MWFTLQGGRVSEVFYPDLSTPSVRTLELTVTDGGKTEKQSTDMTTVVSRPDSEFAEMYRQLAGRVAAQLYWQGEIIPGEIAFRAV